MNKRNTEEMYFSVDVEADGRVPGLGSMLSFGVAAFDLDADDPLQPVGTYEANLELLDPKDWPLCHPDPDTMAWWAKQPEAWAACRKNLRDPAEVFPEFHRWVRQTAGKKKPVLVVFPSWDHMWILWYSNVFGKLQPGQKPPFGIYAYDIKSKAADRMKCRFRQSTKRNMPKRWFKGAPKHTHIALDDAIGQGVLFVNMELEEYAPC